MPTSNVEVVEIGIAGPPGAGVSASTITDIQTDISTLQNDLDAAEGNLTQALLDITALESQVAALETLWFGIEIDGGGSEISTGVRRRIKIPYDCTIVADSVDGHIWQVLIEPAGLISIDLWMESYSALPATSADRISGTVGSQNPRITSTGIKNGSGSTTGWTLNLVGGEYLYAEVVSVTNATFATVSLHVTRA